ncbi:MAG: Fe-S cluster assembly protein IscX [Pseudomonadales bacterium]|jgi:FeS assembly protein IscX|nr:Fe-S cluster assembly protein IscX [Pseudomonadales bacterium]
MKWADIHDIAIELSEQKPDIDPITVRFTDLWQWVLDLDGFDDDRDRCNEKILEAIQTAWIEELD